MLKGKKARQIIFKKCNTDGVRGVGKGWKGIEKVEGTCYIKWSRENPSNLRYIS
jgi:hypothetical protein